MAVYLYKVTYDVSKLVNASVGIWWRDSDIVTWQSVPLVSDRGLMADQIVAQAAEAQVHSSLVKRFSLKRGSGTDVTMELVLDGNTSGTLLGLDTPTTAVYPTADKVSVSYACWTSGETPRLQAAAITADVLAMMLSVLHF